MTFLLAITCYLFIGVLISIHRMRTKWLPANKASVILCILTWLGFAWWAMLDYLVGKLVELGKGKDVQ